MDAWLDAELDPLAVQELSAHLAPCTACRNLADDHRRLKETLRRLPLPSPPAILEQKIRQALDREDAPRTTAWRWIAIPLASAALILMVFSIQITSVSAVPDVINRSSRWHDQICSSQIQLLKSGGPENIRRYFKENLEIDVTVPEVTSCELLGGCPCAVAASSKASPLIVYRRGQYLLSLLVVEGEAGVFPVTHRRTAQGREYYVFRAGRNTLIVCNPGKICHIWVSRLGERDMLEMILDTREGRQIFDGVRLSLSGIT